MKNIDLVNLAKSVVTIAEAASKVILEIYAKADLGVEFKADDSPVTLADQQSDALIRLRLSALTPDTPVISEEGEEIDYEIRSQYESYWLVDPLDGTKEFVKRNGDFTINIALMHANEPILGVVYIPTEATAYWAAKDCGAWQNDKAIRADTFTLSQSGLGIAVSRSHFNQATSDFVGGFVYPRLMARGSALKMLLVASGEAHIHPRFGTTMEWDTAAAQVIVQEAGGRIERSENQGKLLYNKRDLRNPNFIVYGNLRDTND